MAEQWEYKTIQTHWADWEKGNVVNELNRLGQQGWEVVATAVNVPHFFVLLKRRKP